MATGRSDYPNQINNVLGFPYIFRGALDVRARTINDEMKIAAAAGAWRHWRARTCPTKSPPPITARGCSSARAISSRCPSIRASSRAFRSRSPRRRWNRAWRARHIADLDEYAAQLSARLDPIAGTLQNIFEQVRVNPKRVVFAEGEEDRMIRAANSFANAGLGKAILIGREDADPRRRLPPAGSSSTRMSRSLNARLSERNVDYANYLYERLQRNGFLFRDCQRLVNNDRNVFAACMVALGDADALVTGLTRNFSVALDNVRRAIDDRPGHRPIGVSMALGARPHRVHRRYLDP